MWPEFWVYRRGDTFYCSEDCMMVDQTKDMKLIHMIAHMRAKKGSNMIKKITDEHKARAVQIAIEGGNPLPYLKSCGSKNPSASWAYIKNCLEKKDPETFAKLHETKDSAQVPTVKVDGPLRIETPEAKKVEVVETPEEAPTRAIRRVGGKYEVSAIRVPNLGEFYYDIKYNSVDWRTPDGAEVSLSPSVWRTLMEELSGIMSALGVKL